jgi:hypothetical protein
MWDGKWTPQSIHATNAQDQYISYDEYDIKRSESWLMKEV